MADITGTQRNRAEGVPHDDGQQAREHNGVEGVSDERRKQLGQMEQEAGVSHDSPADGGEPGADTDPAPDTNGTQAAGGRI